MSFDKNFDEYDGPYSFDDEFEDDFISIMVQGSFVVNGNLSVKASF